MQFEPKRFESSKGLSVKNIYTFSVWCIVMQKVVSLIVFRSFFVLFCAQRSWQLGSARNWFFVLRIWNWEQNPREDLYSCTATLSSCRWEQQSWQFFFEEKRWCSSSFGENVFIRCWNLKLYSYMHTFVWRFCMDKSRRRHYECCNADERNLF